jgi:hypothetical protein
VTSAGRHVNFYNVESERTTILQVTDVGVLRTTGALVSPSGKYIALLQASAEHGPISGSITASATVHQVAIYNLKLGKLCSTITPATAGPSNSTVIVDFGFSEGLSKTLFIMWGAPEPRLVLYRWYTSKAQCSLANLEFSRFVGDPASERMFIGVAGTAAYRIEQDAEGSTLLKRCLHTLAKVCTSCSCSCSVACDVRHLATICRSKRYRYF